MANCGCCGQALPEMPSTVQVVAEEHPGLPVAAMLDRGWLGDATTVADADDLRRRLRHFFRHATDAERRILGPALATPRPGDAE